MRLIVAVLADHESVVARIDPFIEGVFATEVDLLGLLDDELLGGIVVLGVIIRVGFQGEVISIHNNLIEQIDCLRDGTVKIDLEWGGFIQLGGHEAGVVIIGHLQIHLLDHFLAQRVGFENGDLVLQVLRTVEVVASADERGRV